MVGLAESHCVKETALNAKRLGYEVHVIERLTEPVSEELGVAARRQMREAGVIYKVYKNTLVKKAIAGTEFEGLADSLEGPTAVAISKDDATAAARVLANFAKEAPCLELKAGVVEGKFCDAKAIAEIAAIPSRDVLLSRLLGSFQSPMANFARVIKQMASARAAAASFEKEKNHDYTGNHRGHQGPVCYRTE